MRIVLRCPAKINTFLSVGPADSSGYHPIRTVFQAISLFDELVLDDILEPGIYCDWAGLPAENTLTRTLRLLREVADIPPFAIQLSKGIPAESGLGGGSSDAAGLLRGLLAAATPGLTADAARQIAAAVGADVPFFLVGGRAEGEGYGVDLRPLPDLPPKWLVVARPNEGVSTAAAYRALDGEPRPWREFASRDEVFNDFERVAPCASLELIERLRIHGSTGATLCGSGSAAFGFFRSKVEADEAYNQIVHEGAPWVRVAKTLTREESLWTS